VVPLLGNIGSQVIVPYRGDGMNVRGLKLCGDLGQIIPLPIDMFDPDSITRAMARSNVVINLIGSYNESSNFSFHDTHVKIAHRLAKLAKEVGVQKFVHVSAYGCQPDSESKFFASKYEGEQAVRDIFPNAIIFRPTPIFGEEDGFFTRIRYLLWRWSNLIVINDGKQKIQPVWIGDVAKAIVQSLLTEGHEGKTYHLAGPMVKTYREFIELVRRYSYHPSAFGKNIDSFPYDQALAKGRRESWFILPNMQWVWNQDRVTQMLYDLVLPEYVPDGMLTFKDVHVTNLSSPLHWIADILRPYHRSNSPDLFESEPGAVGL